MRFTRITFPFRNNAINYWYLQPLLRPDVSSRRSTITSLTEYWPSQEHQCNTLIDNGLADACFWGYVTPTENCSFNLTVASLVLENREKVTFASALLNFLFFQKFLFSSLIFVELDSDLVLLNFSRMQEPFFSYQRKGGSIKSQVDQLSLYVRIRIQG